jgi:4-amino-4-deoxy-L-arabinose transferase-like glycosyltransferase
LIFIIFHIILFCLVILILARNDKKLLSILLGSLLIRVFLIFIHNYVFALPDSQFDAIVYEQLAWEWAKDGIIFDDFTTGAFLFSWLNSLLYILFGRIPILIQLYNTFGALIIIYSVFHLSKKFWGRKNAYITSILLSLYPTFLLYSVLVMREIPVILFLVLSVSFFVKWYETNKSYNIIIAIFSAITSMIFHSGMIGMVLGLLAIIYLIIGYRIYVTEQYKLLITVIGVSLVIVLVGYYILTTGIGLEKFGGGEAQIGFNELAQWQQYASRSRGAYLQNIYMDNFTSFIFQMPVRLLFFLITPFIWMVSNFGDLVAFIDGSIIGIFLFLIYRRFKRNGYNSIQKYLFIWILSGLMVFSIATSNYGTALRHRAKFVPLILLLAPLRVSETNKIFKLELK